MQEIYNEVFIGDEATKKLVKGMKIVYDAVSRTMGASGRNVVYKLYGFPKVTNDGVSVANEIMPKDETERLGANWIKQVAQRTVDETGDGTTTATVLAYEMVMKGLEKVRAGSNAMRLRREMNESVKTIVAALKKNAKKVTTDEELLQIATISVENPEIAQLVMEAAKKAGIDGTVIVDESTAPVIEKEEFDGYKLDQGYLSPYMMTNVEKMECLFEDVPVLVTDKKLLMNRDIFGLLETVVRNGHKQLLIIADDVAGELLQTVIANRVNPKGAIHVTVVHKPYSPEALEDIAVFCGASTLTDGKGVKELDENHYTSLGRAKKVIVTKDYCQIIGGMGAPEKLAERMASIKHELSKAEDYEQRKLKDRLGRLNGSVTVIKVGAPTRADMKYLKDKVDDAVHAVRAALEEGIVTGGGRALYDFSLGKPKNEGDAIIRHACGQPIRTILTNAGENAEKILALLQPGEVFDVFQGVVSVDPVKDGIIDPVKVERCALANAANFASLFLTTDVVIADLPVDKDKTHQTVV